MSASRPTLLVVTASTRPGRVGPHVAAWFAEAARAHGKFEIATADLAEIGLPIFDEPRHPRLGQYEHDHTKAWSAEVAAADAVVFVVPEYNFGPTPALVNALDYLSKEWSYKPAGFVSYGGASGGLRSVEATKPLLVPLKLVAMAEQVMAPMVSEQIKDDAFAANELQEKGAVTMLDEMLRWAEALKPLRA